MTKKMDFSWLSHLQYVNQQDAAHGSAHRVRRDRGLWEVSAAFLCRCLLIAVCLWFALHLRSWAARLLARPQPLASAHGVVPDYFLSRRGVHLGEEMQLDL